MDELLLVGRVLLSLACVVGLIWYLARRLGARRSVRDDREPTVRVVDRQALTRGAGVAVVAVGNRRLLVGFAEQQVTMLTELRPVAEPVAWGTGATSTTGDVPTPHEAPAAETTRPAALDGSVLSPQTWRATLRALQDRTVRR